MSWLSDDALARLRSAASAPDLSGTRYRLLGEAGRGGMCTVFLAEDPVLERRVALKVLDVPDADGDLALRLAREAKILARLEHPGIAPVHDVGRLPDGRVFYAMQYVEGPRLDAFAATTRNLLDRLRVFQRIVEAVAFAHDRGILHRDLKPENVMRTTDGRLKILDFGLALIETRAGAFASMAGNLTLPRAVVGTPAYMAPEQLKGERADSRTDVFALGVVLYEYACGTHPFHADDIYAIAYRILHNEPTPIGHRRSDLPSPLATAITRCLRKPPPDRFPSATEIADALNHADSAPIPGRLTPWWRTHQLAVIALYFTACVLTWQIKEWEPGIATALFIATCAAATVGGVLRGNLLWLERVTGTGLATEQRRATKVTLTFDLAISLVLVADGALLAFGRPVPSALTIALGVVIAIATLVIEPATTTRTFAQPESG
jgi:tRNA A-37 threonylcarbamoyl transferase component Bud32